MQAIQHFKSCCRFWQPSVSRRLTVNFLLFGLIVFYLTSLGYMLAAKRHFIRSITQIVQYQLYASEGRQAPDALWQSLGRSQPRLDQVARVLRAFSSLFFTLTDTAFYCRRADSGQWLELVTDAEGRLTVRAAAPDASTASLRRLRLALSDERLSSLIEISRPQDRHRYFLQVGFDRQGLFAIAVSRLGHVSLLAAGILIGLRILSYGFARRLARPIENLSRSAAEVARGNLDVHLPVETRDEIGTLTHNFNRMVAGLKEREAVRLMEYDMERGRQIQRDFLPRQMPRIPEWDIAAFFDPARQVSGDFYDVFPVDDRRLGLVIADVCDKGLGSAFYMALFRSLIRIYAEQERASWPDNDPRQTHLTDDPDFCVRVVQRTNDYVAHNHGQDGMFATVFFGLLDPASGRLHYVNAGHEPLYVVGRDGLRTPLNPTGPAVGLMPGMSFRAAREVLAPGEALMGFTDGVVEARSPQDEPYSRNRLQALLAEPSNSAGALLEKVKESLYRFIEGAPPEDDVTMIAIQRSLAAV